MKDWEETGAWSAGANKERDPREGLTGEACLRTRSMRMCYEIAKGGQRDCALCQLPNMDRFARSFENVE